MQLIDHLKDTWGKNIKTKDRFIFSLVLLILLVLYYQKRYVQMGVHFSNYQYEVYTLLGFLVSFILIDFWGNFILRCWLSVSGLIGKCIFFLLLFVVYYVVLSPVFLLVNLTRKKKVNTNSNWADKIYTNTDFNNMG